ncbi:hypothetical protein D3C81_1614870 [compost metagenome]
MLVAVVLRAPRIVERPAFTDAHPGFVGGKVFLLDETYVVGSHQRRADLVGQGHGCVQLLFIVGTVGTLDFQVKTVREHRHPLASQGFGFVRVAAEQGHADLALLGC